jgi:T5SS/PEP-CTERM-associated repeat protein/autotransporter-associated beta strand protein
VLIVNASIASVSGVNSRWTNRQYLDIDGGSSLAVRDQGAVDGGYQVDVWGAANVSTGGSLTTTGPLRLGGSADRPGLLTVQSGGLVISAGGELGYSGAGTAHSGAVAISGAGSTWFNSGVLVVGGASGNDPSYFGSGTISIDKGGWLASGASTVGNQAGAYGKVAVDGTGSRWNSSGDIVVGNLAIGIVEVTNGAQLSSVRGHVGYAAGSNGAVTVSGAGSSWAASGSLFIGNAGNGQLNVLDGAVVSTAGNSYLGFAAGSQGAATVDGAGSVWNTTAAGTNLNIGGSQTAAGGVGTLSIGPGGAVHTAAANLYATGTLLLTGDAVFTGPITAYGGTVRSIGVSSLGNAITLGTGGLSVQPRDPASTLTFSGNISGTGGLYKSNFIGTGSGTLVLTGNNTYTGATVIDIGNLLVNGTQNSMVQVNSGALGGTGAILAAVQVGNDVGTADATIAPGSGVGNGLGVGTLSTGDLNIRADGVYAFQIDSVAAAADRIVVTGGVVLASGATFSFNDTSAANVAPGTSFVAIANDDVDAILGQFANLAQGGIFSVGANSYQASYFGGTGNDLVLTSVPVPEPARPALLLCGLVAVALWRQRRRDA